MGIWPVSHLEQPLQCPGSTPLGPDAVVLSPDHAALVLHRDRLERLILDFADGGSLAELAPPVTLLYPELAFYLARLASTPSDFNGYQFRLLAERYRLREEIISTLLSDYAAISAVLVEPAE